MAVNGAHAGNAFLRQSRRNVHDNQPRGHDQCSVNTQQHEKPHPRPHMRPYQCCAEDLATATSIRKAIEDGYRAEIPLGYSTKNWDPTMKPILLLGSVFDANSLGKWIYDWTAVYHGEKTRPAEMTRDFGVLLIHLAGRMRRAQESEPNIRRESDRKTLKAYLESEDCVCTCLIELLKTYETDMWGG